MYQLEERILFDGAAVADVAAVQQEQQAQEAQAQAQPPADPSHAPDQAQTQTSQDPSPILNPDSAPAVQNTDIAADATPVAAAIDPSASAAQPADTHVNVLVVSDSLENADSLFQSANSDTIIVKYDPKTTTSTELLRQITDALNGEKADSIGFVTDKAHDGAVEIFADSDTSAQSLSSEAQQNFWNGVEGLLGDKGKVNIFASNLASTDNGRHLVDSLSEITNHQVAASTDVTGDTDAGGNWELEYVAKGTGSVDLIDQYFNRDAIQSFDHRIENPTEIAFIDSSVRDASTIVSQLDSDVEVVYLSRDNAFNDITDYLNGRTDVDSISLISDADYTTGGFFLGNDTVNSDFLDSHHDALAAWGKSMSADGDIHIYGCNVAKDQVGKDLINQIASATGADVAASTDITGLAGNWNLEYAAGTIETHDFTINNYYHNLNTLTVRNMVDLMVTNPDGVQEANLTLRGAILIANDGDNIVFADYTVLHPDDPVKDWIPGARGPLYSSEIYHFEDIAGVNTLVNGLVNTLTIKTNITIDGNIVTPQWTDDADGVHLLENNIVILDARDSFRGIYVDSQMNADQTGVILQNMIIQNGRSLSTDSAPAAGNGGGIYVSGISSLEFKTVAPSNGRPIGISTVQDSQATYGGGIYNVGVLTFSGIATSNTADDSAGSGNGGGIYNAGSLMCTGNNSISGNRAFEHGGGIYNNGTLDVTGASAANPFFISSNDATNGSGGGIYSNNGNISLTYATVGYLGAGNTAGNNGGGIYIFSNYEQSSPMHFTRTDVGYNTANVDGGGIYLTNGNSTTTANVFELEWSYIQGNTATIGNGGGISLFNNAGNIAIKTVFDPASLYNTQSFITGNKTLTGNGAGVYIENCANVTMDFINMSGNIAAANGGAIYVKDSGTVTLTDMEIASNQALNGGGIYYTNATSGTLNVQRSNISNNFASSNGAGVYQANGILIIENDTLSKNASVGAGGAIYMDYGNLSINFATLAYNESLGLGAAIYIDGDPAAANKSVLTVKNSIIYNLDTDTFASQIYIPVSSQINVSGFSTTSNIYSHYFMDQANNTAGHTLVLTMSGNPLISRLYGTDAGKATAIQNNLYLDTNLLYHANYRTMALAIISPLSWASTSNAAAVGSVTYDQRGNTRSGSTWTWDSAKNTWVSATKTASIGAFEPIFHTEVTSKGDDSQLWYTGDTNAHYFDEALKGGLTLREAIYWIDTRANALPADYDIRYVGFDKTLFGTANDGIVYNNSIQLNYGQIEIGSRWGNSDASADRDVAVGYMIRNTDGSVDPTKHDNTLRSKDDASRITVLAGKSGEPVYAANRLFLNSAGSVLALNNLTISGGVGEVGSGQNSDETNGGGILNRGDLTLINMVVQECTAAGGNLDSNWGGKGGGVYNIGTAYIYDSSINNNTATAIRTEGVDESPNAGQGGGIWNGGTMTVDRSQINGNAANGSSDFGNAMLGGGIFNSLNLTIERSEISGNTVSGSTIAGNAVKGAGIFNGFTSGVNMATLNMANCTVAGNTLDTNNVKIDYEKGRNWGSYGSAVYNNGSIISYYNTVVNNEALVSDATFWNPETLKTINLESMAAFYNDTHVGAIDDNGFSATGAINNGGGYAAGTLAGTPINVNGFAGGIAIGSYVTIGVDTYEVSAVTTNGLGATTSIAFTTALANNINNLDPVTRVVNTGALTISVEGFNGVIAVGTYITIAGDPNPHQVTGVVGGATPTSITFTNATVNPVAVDAVVTAGRALSLSNSMLVENRAILTAGGFETWQRSDLYVRTGGGVLVDPAFAGDGTHNIIGAYNDPRTEQLYEYLPISTATVPGTDPAYYELTYSGTSAVYTPIYQYVAQADGTPVNTGFDWADGTLNNQVASFTTVAATGAPDYLSIEPTTAEFLFDHNLPKQYMDAITAGTLTAPFIYTQELTAGGIVVPNSYIKITGFDATTGLATFVKINTTDNGGSAANPTAGLYTDMGITPYTFAAANTAYSDNVYSGTTPVPVTAIFGPGGTPLIPGVIPDVSNLQYGLVNDLNLDYTLNYNGALTRTLRVLNGSVAMDAGTLVADPGGVFHHLTTDQRGVDRTILGGLPTTVTNIGSFDYLSGSLVVKSAYDSATPRSGFDYTSYTPLWDSSTLTLREATLLADDGSDITFKDTWQINGTKYIDPVTLEVYTVGLTGTTAFPATGTAELNASGNLIINLVSELTVNRTVTIDGMFDWNAVDTNGNITTTHTGSIAQLVAGTNSRLFNIKSAVAGSLSTVGISNFVMSNGNVAGNGGGIFSSANLWLDNVTIQNCKATASSALSDGMGGGIYSDQGYLQMVNSTISGNTATFGGGIYVSGKDSTGGVVLDIGHVNRLVGLVPTDFWGGCSIVNNTANQSANGSGGGVYLLSGNGNVIYSTVGDNKAVSDGGGIYVATTGDMSMANSTVANNTAGRHGGGIAFNSFNTLDLDYTTIANNQSGWTILGAASGNAFASGGGIYMNSGTLNLTNSILAQNFSGKFNNNTALIQSGTSSANPSVAITLANQKLGIHDDLFSDGANNISNSVYGAVCATLAPPVASYQVLSGQWGTFGTTKLDTKLTDNGGRTKTVYVYDTAYFSTAFGGAGYDQTQLENFGARITCGAYENSVEKVLFYVDGELTKGRDGGSNWVNGNGDTLTEASGVLNASNAIFVFDNATLGFVDPTLNYNWTLNGPDWTGKFYSWIEVRNAAQFTVAATVADSTSAVTLNGRIVLKDASTLELSTTSLDTTKLSVTHNATSDITVIYDSTSSIQKVLAVDAISQQAMKYDNLLLYGKAGAALSTKSAQGPITIYNSLEVGDGTDNVKLHVFTVTGVGNANLQILQTLIPATSTIVHNFGEIDAAKITITGTDATPVNIDGGGKIVATSDLDLTDVVINTQKTITVGGNFNLNDVTITGLAVPNQTIANVTGDISFDGTIALTNVTINSGSNRTVFFGNTIATTVSLNGDVTIGSATGTVHLEDCTILVTGLNNNIVSKGLDVTTGPWTLGNSIQVVDGVSGALKINIGAQNLTVTDNTTNSTATDLNFGLDRLTINAANRFEIVTTGTVTSTVTAPAGAIAGTLALAGNITLDNSFSNIVGAPPAVIPAATLELGGTIMINEANLVMDNSLSIVGTTTVNKLLVPGNTSIISNLGSLSIGTIGSYTGNGMDLTLTAGVDVTIGNITGVKALTVNAVNDILLTKSIKVGGDLNLSAGNSINGGFQTITATGNITFAGDITLQDLTVLAGSGKLITFSNDLALNGNTVIGSSTSTIVIDNTNIVVNGLNNNILSKYLNISGWDAGRTINVTGGSALKMNVGAQALKLVAGDGTSTATLLSLGVDRLDVDAGGSLELVTTNAAPITAASGAAGTVDGTLILTGKTTIDSNFTLTLNNAATLQFNGATTIKKDAVGNDATINMPNSIVFANSVKVDTGVTGAVFITSTNGDVTLGSDVTAGAKYSGNNKNLTLTSALGDVTLGNILAVKDLSVNAGTDIHLWNSITSIGNIEFLTANPNGVQVHKAFATTATKTLGTTPTVIKITAGKLGTIGNVNNTGFEAFGGDGSELWLTAGNLVADSNIGPVSLNRSLSLLKGRYVADSITFTGTAANLVNKGPLTVNGDVTLIGGKLDNFNALTIAGAGDIILTDGSLVNETAGTINAPNNITLNGTATLTNKGILTGNPVVGMGSGLLTNSKTMNVDSITYTANGSLTNTGTLTVTNGITLVGNGALNNNAGTLSADTIDMANGNLTNKAILNTDTITFTGGAGNIINSKTINQRGVAGVDITFDGGSLTNTGTMTTIDALAFTVNGGLNNNAGTLTANTIDLVGGTITNKAILNTDTITFAGTGSVNNTKTMNEKTGGAGLDITFAGGNLTNGGTMNTLDALVFTGNGALTNNAGSLTANTIDLVDGTLFNKATLYANSVTFTGTGNLTNSKTLGGIPVGGFIDITLAGGSLTNTGTMATVNALSFNGFNTALAANSVIGDLNNNLGTLTTNTIDLTDGTLTNKAILTANTITIGGTGNLLTSKTLKADAITLNGGDLTNSGTGIIAERTVGGAGDFITLVGGTLTNSSTSTSAIIIDTLTLDGADLSSSKALIVHDTLTLTGAGIRNLSFAGTAMADSLDLQSNTIMTQGKLTVTDFTFNAAVYFQMNNSAAGTSLEITGDYAVGLTGLNGCDATHYFVTVGTSKVWIKPTSNATQQIFLTDSTTNPVIEIDLTGNTPAADKLVGLSTFTPITVNGKHDGIPVGSSNQTNAVNRVWTVTRSTGDASALTMKFFWNAAEQGAGLNYTDGSLFQSTGTGWSTGPTKGTGAGLSLGLPLDVGNYSYETSNMTSSGAYSVSNYPMLAMNDDTFSFGQKFDELREKFMDAIFGGSDLEAQVAEQQVAAAEEKAAVENMFAQMAARGHLMERNNLFKSEVDLGLEALLAV
ncbi:MAG: DUF4347 domain-containing protein [Victivallales bacterium]